MTMRLGLLCVVLSRFVVFSEGNVADKANRTLHLAWASYCNESSLEAWTCQWCEPESKLTLIEYLKDTKHGTQGYVGLQGNTIVVSFRGSKNFANTVQDMQFWRKKFPYAKSSGGEDLYVDHGFFEAYDSLRNQTIEAVMNATKTRCVSSSNGNCEGVLITGHSLGSAMGTMLAGELAMYVQSKINIYNFGSPRVGDAAFVKWVDDQIAASNGSSTRMRREKDIVPAIPPRSIGYRHISTEIYEKHPPESFVVCDGSGEDPTCGDSEEHPPFPLDLLHMEPSEHTRYLGIEGGSCSGGSDD